MDIALDSMNTVVGALAGQEAKEVFAEVRSYDVLQSTKEQPFKDFAYT